MKVAIVDLGCGNVGSVSFALDRLGAHCVLTTNHDQIASADRVILPGVGAANFAMRRIEELGLAPVLKSLLQPVLGICLGMHLLFERSEEGETECLGLIPGTVRKLGPAKDCPIPHMGWSKVKSFDPHLGLDTGDYLYFAHSFAFEAGPAAAATAVHGKTFAAAVRLRNWTGVQFHPERSGEAGAHVLESFLA